MIGTTKKILAISLLMLPAIGSNVAIAREDGFYYLMCRGGGQLNPIIQPTEDTTQIILNFRSSPTAWKNETSLNAGQCTWADRKLSDDEP